MSFVGAPGFFGKLPSAGDFVQRRLPAKFIDKWDLNFERCVAETRAVLATDWRDAYQNSPVWRFLMAPGVCGAEAWAGVMGPASDRVGRCFPMVIAGALSSHPTAAIEVLSQTSWFAGASEIMVGAQQDPQLGVEAFDARVAALSDLVTEPAGDALKTLKRHDWANASLWRLPQPLTAVLLPTYLATLWSRLGEGEWCLWWTAGSGRVSPGVFVTLGLPAPQDYARFLDAEQAGNGQPPERRQGASEDVLVADEHRSRQALDDLLSPTAASAAPPPPPPTPGPQPLPSLPPAPSFLPVGEDAAAGAAAVPGSDQQVNPSPSPMPTGATDPEPATPFASVLGLPESGLIMVAADNGGHDPEQRAASSVLAAARELVRADIYLLRDRLLGLHARWSPSIGNTATPTGYDCAVAAVQINGTQCSLLRIGAAAAWRLHSRQLQALFVPRSAASGDAVANDLDDLLFNAPPLADAGLGLPGTPAWEDTTCFVQPGDRLLLAVTQTLVQLSPDLIARALMMRTREEASTRLAAAARLSSDARRWPFAVIEIG